MLVVYHTWYVVPVYNWCCAFASLRWLFLFLLVGCCRCLRTGARSPERLVGASPSSPGASPTTSDRSRSCGCRSCSVIRRGRWWWQPPAMKPPEPSLRESRAVGPVAAAVAEQAVVAAAVCSPYVSSWLCVSRTKTNRMFNIYLILETGKGRRVFFSGGFF